MPQLIENGYVYIALPPLYKVKKGRKEMYVIKEHAYLKDAVGREFRGEELGKLLRDLREYEDSYKALVKNKGEDVVNFLLAHRVVEDDLRSANRVKEIVRIMGEELTDYRVDTRYDEFEGAYDLILYDDRLGTKVIVDADFLSSLSYKQVLDGIHLHLPAIVGYDSKSRKVKSINEVYDTVMDLVKSGIEIQRYKGLGEMNPQEFIETYAKEVKNLDV